MTKDPFKEPKHNYPILNVGISASQNVLESTIKADMKEAASFHHYLSKGSMPSLKFTRTADRIVEHYDENKAMFPIYQGVPLFAVPTIAMLEAGLNVHVLGSHEAGKIISLLSEYYSSLDTDDYNVSSVKKRLKWIPELDGMKDTIDPYKLISENSILLSQKNSLSRLANSFELKENDAWAFVAGDIIVYNPSFAYDRDIINHSMVIDFNGLEIINPPVPRNYYHALITPKGKIHIKEPNIWLLGAEIQMDNSDELYKRRMKGDFGVANLISLAGNNMVKYWDRITFNNVYGLLNAARQEAKSWISKKISSNPAVPCYYPNDLEGLCKFVYMSPLRIKAEHTDWLRLKDVDAVHDYVLIRTLLETHLDDVLPTNVSSRIKGFSSFLAQSKIADEIPILHSLPQVINDKVSRVEMVLSHHYKMNVKLELPFDFNGNLRPIFGKDESVEAVLERCRRDLDSYERLKLK